jgi:uncharacterized phage protein gp47/JayE
MYESVTYEGILERMLAKVPDDMDKREGSVIYNALAPAAVELQLMYIELDVILRETFADTASREYLVRRAAERGVTPDDATYAILKGEFTPTTLEIPVGSRFSCNTLNYFVKEKITEGVYQLQCEKVGIGGNENFGNLIPINYLTGLETAKITELLIPGEDEEGVESLRVRYFDSLEEKAFSGNRKDYIEKTNAVSGVGATKVLRAWNGYGTVKLVILDAQFNKASSTLLGLVQETIDPVSGSGDGLAPIDHVVTVSTVSEISVSIVTQMTFSSGYTYQDLQSQIETVIQNYLMELRKAWNMERPIVRISQIESRLLTIQGVLDIKNTTINGGNENLELGEYDIPVFGGVTVG